MLTALAGWGPLMVAALVFAIPRVVGAQASTPPSLRVITLPEALSYARDHQPQIRSALAEFAARRAEARIPRSQWMPQIGATAQIFVGTTNNTTTSYLGVPEVDLPRIGATKSTTSTDWSPSPSTMAALTVDQEVYDFGRIAAQISAADALASVARANAEAVSLDIQLGVEEAYHAVLAARQVMAATEDAYRRAVTHRDYAQAGTKSGMRPPIDLTRAQADVAQLEVRRVRASTGLEAAQAGLSAAIGADTLLIDAQPLDEGQSAAPAFEEVLRTAAQKNPAVVAALARVEAQRSTTTAIFREMLPNVFASGTLSGRAGGALPASGDTPFGAGWLPAVGNWHLGLVLSWNIFDATILSRRAASKSREEATRADLETIRTAVALYAERSYLDLDAALKALPGLAAGLEAARANQAQADARFRAGLGNIVELADAETLLTNAQLELAIGRFAVARGRAALGRAMGKSLLSPTSKTGKGS